MSTSSTVYLLLLSGVFYLFGVGPLGAIFLNSLTLTLCAFFFARLAGQFSTRRSLAIEAVSAIIVMAALLQSSVGLMETSIALLLLAIGCSLYKKGDARCFIPLAIAPFVRLEMAGFYLLLFVFGLVARKFKLTAILLWSLLAGAPLALFNLYYFKTLIPNTVIAKKRVYSLDYADSLDQFIEILSISSGTLTFCLGATLLLLVMAILLKQIKIKSIDPLILILFVAPISLFIAYLTQKTFIFQWYAPLIVLPLLFSIYLLAISKESWLVRAALGLLTIPTLFSPTLILMAAVTTDYTWHPDYHEGARVRRYLQVGSNLYQKYPNATLMTSEIGALGFGFKGKVVDGAGLVSPEALKFHPLSIPKERSHGTIGGIPAEFIALIKPEIIVSYPTFIKGFLKSEIIREYQVSSLDIFLADDMARLDRPRLWNNRELLVFKRLSKLDESESN